MNRRSKSLAGVICTLVIDATILIRAVLPAHAIQAPARLRIIYTHHQAGHLSPGQ